MYNSFNQLLEVINNTCKTIQSIPDILREAKGDRGKTTIELGKHYRMLEEHYRIVDIFKNDIDFRDKRIAELELQLSNAQSSLDVHREFSNNRITEITIENSKLIEAADRFAEDVSRLELEVSRLNKAYDVNFRENGEWKNWCLVALTRRGKLTAMTSDPRVLRNVFMTYVDELEAELATMRAAVVPCEPDYGVGFERCGKEEAVEAVHYHCGHWNNWVTIDKFSFHDVAERYRFRRPIAKPLPIPPDGFGLCDKSECVQLDGSKVCYITDNGLSDWYEYGHIFIDDNIKYYYCRLITFITGEPEVGEGWEFCDIEQATEATIFLAGAKVWSIWKSVKDYRFIAKPECYRFRRPIAKVLPAIPDGYELCSLQDASLSIHCTGSEWEPVIRNLDGSVSVPCGHYYYCRPITKSAVEAEPLWVACTAAEAELHRNDSEWFMNEGEWCSVGYANTKLSVKYPYRTKAKLSEWVDVSNNIFEAICARDDLHTIDKIIDKTAVDGIQLRRSTIPVGTVLG